MYDLILRNGRVVDGSGHPAFVGDVALRDGHIAAVGGRIASPARRELDVAGRVVAPGFIDPHTHFDAQLLWDGRARPALEHGVTTVVPGNCSLSLAPIRPEHRPRVVGMFQQIEEMPDAAFDGAFTWDFQDFRGYLDALRGNLAINVAPLVGHSVIRLWVMEDAATERAATPEEIARMQQALRECLDAGALGLSTSFVDVDEKLEPVPSRYAHQEELDALAAVLGEYGRMLQVVPEFYSTDITIARVDQLSELSLAHGIPTTFSPLFDSAATPENVDRVMARVEEQFARGARVWPQMQTRPIDISFSFEQASLLFAVLPSWYHVLRLPRDAKIAAFRDPETRGKLLKEVAAIGGGPQRFADLRIRATASEALRPLVGRTLGSLAEARGVTPAEAMIDLSLDDDLRTHFLAESLGHQDPERVGPYLAHPLVHVGASDGGAHIQSFATYGDTGYLLSRFVRDCGHLTLEQAVRKITAETATIWGIPERGELRPGFAGDVVVFDPGTVARADEVMVHDMPEGGMRYVREARGIDTVIVNGEIVWSAADGYTPARPGRIATASGAPQPAAAA